MNAVSATVALRMLAAGREVPLEARFSYDTADPYEVKMELRTGLGDPVTWVFARELLTGGLTAATGAGDVTIWPCSSGQTVGIGLSSPSGTAWFEGPAEGIARFLAATRRLAEIGAEPARADLDTGIAAILAQGGLW